MTTGGWIFLVLATAFVWGLAAWCYYKVLTGSDHFTEPPASLGG